MNAFQERNWSFGLVSGIAEVFWFVFTCKWCYVYYHSHDPTRFPLHTIFLLRLFITNLFYVVNTINEFLPTDSLEDVNWACFSLYMTLTYFVGFSISLGFGTTYLLMFWSEWILAVVLSGVVCLVYLLDFLHFSSISDASAIIALSIFGVQVTITNLTRRKLLLEYHSYPDLSVSMLVPQAYIRARAITIYFLILTVLFVIQVLETYLVYVGQISSGYVYIWLIATLSSMIIDSVAIWLTRPRKELLDVSRDSRSNPIRELLCQMAEIVYCC